MTSERWRRIYPFDPLDPLDQPQRVAALEDQLFRQFGFRVTQEERQRMLMLRGTVAYAATGAAPSNAKQVKAVERLSRAAAELGAALVEVERASDEGHHINRGNVALSVSSALVFNLTPFEFGDRIVDIAEITRALGTLCDQHLKERRKLSEGQTKTNFGYRVFIIEAWSLWVELARRHGTEHHYSRDGSGTVSGPFVRFCAALQDLIPDQLRAGNEIQIGRRVYRQLGPVTTHCKKNASEGAVRSS